MTSFFRYNLTIEAINKIYERTEPGSFQLHIYDNGSDHETQDKLINLLKTGRITSLMLDSRNTGCLYDKLVFYAMTETANKYFCVTDNDIFPPKIQPDWLEQMIKIMDNHPELALLTPHLPPTNLQVPYKILPDICYCEAVGNTLKLVRRDAFPLELFNEQKLGAFGDDGMISASIRKKGLKVAFCHFIYCWHAGQCENWGYKPEEIALDIRKAGYGEPFIYTPMNDAYDPPPELRLE